MMEILTEFQKQFLLKFSKTSLKAHFFLTGGTTLSAFYLQHRFSEDLDFFTEEPGQVSHVLPILEKIVKEMQAQLEVRRQFLSFLECFIDTRKGEILKCDFAEDSPYRLKEKILNDTYHVYIDNILDIACNKLSALFDRSDPKDFVDIYFIHKEIMPLEDIFKEARQKHPGLDHYWLAIAFSKAEEIIKLPRMVKTIDLSEMKQFYREKAKWLMSQK